MLSALRRNSQLIGILITVLIAAVSGAWTALTYTPKSESSPSDASSPTAKENSAGQPITIDQQHTGDCNSILTGVTGSPVINCRFFGKSIGENNSTIHVFRYSYSLKYGDYKLMKPFNNFISEHEISIIEIFSYVESSDPKDDPCDSPHFLFAPDKEGSSEGAEIDFHTSNGFQHITKQDVRCMIRGFFRVEYEEGMHQGVIGVHLYEIPKEQIISYYKVIVHEYKIPREKL